MKQRIHTIREFLLENPLLITLVSMGWNLTFALVNGILGLIYTSYWYQTLFAFYLLLGLMKMSAVTVKKSRRRTEADMLLHTGLAMFALAVILCGLMVLTILEHRIPEKNKTIMILTAAFTFIFLGVTIRNTVRALKNKSPVMIAVRNISCASALVSILSLESSMMGTFGDEYNNFVQEILSWTGVVVFFILVGFGLNLLTLSWNVRKSGTSR